jgi:membrane protease YdiL (CAAX protease family)
MEVLASNSTTVSRRSVWAFVVLLCVLSWPVWLVSGVLPRAGTGGYDARWLVAQIGVMGPSLAALLVSASLSRELRWNSLRLLPFVLGPLVVPGILVARASPVRVSQMPLLPALATVVVAALVVLFLSPLNSRLLGSATGTPQARPPARVGLFSLTLLPALFLLSWAFVSAQGGQFEIVALQAGPLGSAWILLVCFAHNLLLGGSLGEELGWRGFLLPALLRERSPLEASIMLAVVGGLWHLPIDLYAGFGVTGPGAILVRILFLVPVSILFTWFYLRSKGSVLIAILLHTSVNVMSDLGLSSYERSAIVFGFLTGVAAVVLSVFSPVLRRATASS